MTSLSGGFNPKAVSRGCAGVAVAIGAVGLAGWIFDLPALQRVHPALGTMKPNAAIGLVLAGIALLLLQEETVAGAKRWLAQGCGGLIALLGAVTLTEVLFGWDAGIDQFFFHESLAAAGLSVPGRMGVAPAVVFTCIGLALFFLDTPIGGKYRAGKLAFLALIATTLVFLFYFYRVVPFEPFAIHATIALHTAVAFFALCVGLLGARPGRGIMALFTGPGVGSVVARRLAPAAFFVPIALGGLLKLGLNANWFGPGFGTAVFVLLMMLVFLALIRWTVLSVNREEAERRLAEAALVRTTANLRDFVDHATVGLHWVGPDGIILWANQAELDLLGYTKEEYLGRPIAEFHADEAVIGDILARLTQGEAIREYEARLRCKDGSIRDVVINSNVLFEDGKFVHTRGFTRDITGQKIAERSRARLAAIVDGSNDAIIGKTLEGVITTWNFGAEKMFGYAADEAIGQSILILIPPARRSEEPEILARIGRDESVHPFESLRLRKDGTPLHVSTTISPVKDAMGKVIGASTVARDITERVRMEEALRQSNERTRNLVESITDAFVTLDREWRFTFLNDRAREILRTMSRSREELLGREHWQEFPAFIGTPLEANLRRAMTERTTVAFELPFPPLDAWMQIRVYPSQDGLSIYYQDITERKLDVEKVKTSERLYRAIGESIDYGVWTCAADGANTYVSESFLKLVGLTQTQCANTGWGAVLHPEDAAATTAAWAECVRTGGNWDREHRFRGVDGQWHTLLARGVPVRDEQGELTGWAGINLDISGLKEAKKTLRETDARFRALAENMDQLAWMSDPAGTLFWYNQRWLDYTGTAFEEMQGRGWEKVQHPEHLARVADKWRHHLAAGEPWEDTFPLRHRDGSYRWFLSRAIPIRDAGGNIARWFGTNTDVTEQRAAVEATEQALNEAKVALRTKDNFLAALSHELRTPLTPVLLSAAALRADARLPADVREQLGMMERNICLEARLIDDLLDLTMITRGRLLIRPVLCDAHSLIGLALEMVRDSAATKAIVIECALAATHRGLVVDPARFQQVIWNLLRNSVKFTPEGGRISIATRDEISAAGTPWLHIEVTDTGIGIESDQFERIFHAFDQGNLTGDHRFGGLGLGLAIARAVVKLHDGRISVSSAGKDRGATFAVAFPTAVLELPDMRHDEPTSGENGIPEKARGVPAVSLRLLLVEDHESTLRTLAMVLQRDGHQVSTARSVGLALETAERQEFDLVISDLGLPDGTGIELMEKLRARHGLPGIALSGYGMEEDRIRTRKAGFLAHLLKPVQIADLRRALAAIPG